MKIRPGWGVDRFPFGLTEPRLLEMLGPPDHQYTTDPGVRRLQYLGPRLEFAFEPENDDRFGWAEVHNPEATLFGRPVIGEQVSSVVPVVTEALGEQPEYEDYGSFQTYFYNGAWIVLRVEFGRVTSVNIGVAYDDSDQPQWPDF